MNSRTITRAEYEDISYPGLGLTFEKARKLKELLDSKKLSKALDFKLSGIFRAGRIHARIIPYVSTIPAVYSQFHIIDMGLFPMLEHKNQFVLRAIERAHTGIIFPPYTKIFKLIIHIRRRHNLFDVPPIHADIMQGTVFAEHTQQFKRRF